MRTALITGASRGIGYQTAKQFAKSGYNVVINYHKTQQPAEELAAEINNTCGVGAVAFCADVSDEEQVRELFQKTRAYFKRVDVLVNNAAIADQQMLMDVTQDDWDAMFATNVRGVFLCAREAMRDMVAQKYGRIINISSIWGITGASCEVCYSATKAAVIGFTRALAKELGPCGVTVNCVAPGVIETDMNADFSAEDLAEVIAQTPLLRMGNAREVASCVQYLASDDAGFITGQVISPNGGIVI